MSNTTAPPRWASHWHGNILDIPGHHSWWVHSSSRLCEFTMSDCWCVSSFLGGASKAGKGNKKANEAAKATLKGVCISLFLWDFIANVNCSHSQRRPARSACRQHSISQRPSSFPANPSILASQFPASLALMRTKSSFTHSTLRVLWRRSRRTTLWFSFATFAPISVKLRKLWRSSMILTLSRSTLSSGMLNIRPSKS